jgi:hypothetical protein
MRPAPRAGRFGTGRRRLAAALVLAVAAGALGLGLHGVLTPAGGAAAGIGVSPGPVATSAPGPTTSLGSLATGDPATAPAGRAPAGTVPVGLRIPALALAVPLSRLGLNPDRTVEVPTDFARAGWFRLGPAPGQPGSAVILGHVDSYRGPAVFYRLGSLRPGNRIEVTRADGATATFAVRAVRSYLKREFPARQVYGSHGGRSLQLVTCGGEFDRSARSYLSNIVVYTELVSIVPARN